MASSLAEANPLLSKEWHPTNNGNLTPADVGSQSHKVVWWICSQGHEEQKAVYAKSKCPTCRFCNSLATVYPKLASEWHPAKNGNLTPSDVTYKSGKKVWWICHCNHEWQAAIDHRAIGGACPYCRGKLACLDNCLATVKPEIASEWHPTKNGHLTPYDVTHGAVRKVWWKCQAQHEWLASPNCRTNRGTRCPECVLPSKGEVAVREALEAINIPFKREFPLKLKQKGSKPLRFDFAICVGKKRALIEYHGQQHYKAIDYWGGQAAFLSSQQRDHAKRALCQRLCLPYLEIPYWEFGNIKAMVTDFVRSME
jgi:hypothetical protein